MGKFIVVEGQDRCGKDTLIKGLRRQIQNPLILDHHSSTPPKGCADVQRWSKTYYENILSLSSRLSLFNGWDVIANRCHLGETVYGPIFRNTDPGFIWDLERDYCKDNAWLIVLVGEGEDIIARDDGLSNEKTVGDYDRVRDAFVSSFNKSSITNKILINVSKEGWPDSEKIYKEIYAQ